jgi:hypothetical protein
LVATFKCFGNCLLAAKASPFEKDEKIAGITALVDIEKSWSAIEALSLWIIVVYNFLVIGFWIK